MVLAVVWQQSQQQQLPQSSRATLTTCECVQGAAVMQSYLDAAFEVLLRCIHPLPDEVMGVLLCQQRYK